MGRTRGPPQGEIRRKVRLLHPHGYQTAEKKKKKKKRRRSRRGPRKFEREKNRKQNKKKQQKQKTKTEKTKKNKKRFYGSKWVTGRRGVVRNPGARGCLREARRARLWQAPANLRPYTLNTGKP